MDQRYRLSDPGELYSPALLFYKRLIEDNIALMKKLAGGPDACGRTPRR